MGDIRLRISKCLPALFLILGMAYAQSETTTNDDGTRKANGKQDLAIGSAFVASVSSIIVSELGDKTFFIAAIMAMRYNRLAVYAGAAFALFLMTAISTAFGWIVPSLIPPKVTHIIVTVLFFFFGGKLLYDAYSDDGTEESDEAAEVEAELDLVHTKMMEDKKKKKQQKEGFGSSEDSAQEPIVDVESGATPLKNIDGDLESPTRSKKTAVTQIAAMYVFWQALTLTFLGEWGDRSQITTIALASQSNALVVFVGAFLGHAFCTGLAVIGGKYLAKKISERMVNISGGVLFLIFGIHNILFA